MRRIGAQADLENERHNFARPRYGEVSWGGGHFDHLLRAETRYEFLRRLRAGDTPEEANAAAKGYAAEMVRKWNRNPCQSVSANARYELERWEQTADEWLDDAMRAILATERKS